MNGMNEASSLLKQRHWRIMDESITGIQRNALESFAIDDTLCASIGSGLSPATARAWVHDKSVVLGIQDTRLPLLQAGLDYLESKGYRVIVRNSGGLAVVLDDGVLNISLILPEIEGKIEINRGYDAMFALIQFMFADFQKHMEAKEIVGSYCPGSYDLSIEGKKFAGISQRRLRNGVAVQVYLAVTNSGSERAKLIQQFYSYAKSSDQKKFLYPKITPNVTASLSELLAVPLTIQDVVRRLLSVLKEFSKQFDFGQLTEKERELFDGYMQRLIERNEKVFQQTDET